nr:immunoglobulin light chain junction region [Macaca mulatta]
DYFYSSYAGSNTYIF